MLSSRTVAPEQILVEKQNLCFSYLKTCWRTSQIACSLVEKNLTTVLLYFWDHNFQI